MRRVTPKGPVIVGGQLYGVRDGPLAVGSPAWHTWLAAEGNREFVFAAQDGGLHRARREWRRESPYWYVKCRVGPQIRRFYLGAPADLDGARLVAVAAAIAAARTAGGEPA
jgi:hypothetical protein